MDVDSCPETSGSKKEKFLLLQYQYPWKQQFLKMAPISKPPISTKRNRKLRVTTDTVGCNTGEGLGASMLAHCFEGRHSLFQGWSLYTLDWKDRKKKKKSQCTSAHKVCRNMRTHAEGSTSNTSSYSLVYCLCWINDKKTENLPFICLFLKIYHFFTWFFYYTGTLPPRCLLRHLLLTYSHEILTPQICCISVYACLCEFLHST